MVYGCPAVFPFRKTDRGQFEYSEHQA